MDANRKTKSPPHTTAKVPAKPKRQRAEVKNKKSSRQITDHKKAKLALQESERRFREMLENMQLVAVLLNMEGRVAYANKFLLQITGYTRDEVIGCDWFAQFVPDARADVKEIFLQALKRGEAAAHYENPIRAKSGEERLIRFSNTLLHDEQGKIIGTTSIGEDITERKQAQESLIESEEKFQTIFKAAPGSMILSSLPDGKTIEVNDNFSLITGYSREEAIGKNTADLKMWADPDARFRFLSIIQSEGRVRDFEADLNHKSGVIRNGLVSGQIITVQGKKYLISAFYDITARKRAEEEVIRRSEELSALNKLAKATTAVLSMDARIQAAIEQVAAPLSADLVMLFLRENGNLQLRGSGPADSMYRHDNTPVHRVGECECASRFCVADKTAVNCKASSDTEAMHATRL